MSNIFLTFRYLVFGLFIVFNAIICIVAAINLGSLIPDTQKFPEVDSYIIFTGALGLVLVFPVIFVEFVRKNAFITRVFFEVIWVGLIWVMNLSAAAAVTSIFTQMDCLPQGKQLKISCMSANLIVAFTWLNTITLLSYLLGLVICAVYHNQDGSVWHSGVRDYRWFAQPEPQEDFFDPSSYGKMVEPKRVSTVPPIYARQMGLTRGYTVEPLRINTNLDPVKPAHWIEFIHSSPAGLQDIPRAAEPGRGITQGGSTEVPTRPSHSYSLYPEHLQSTAVPQVSPPRAGGPTPPPAGSWPRSKPQEPLRRSKRRTKTTNDTFTPSNVPNDDAAPAIVALDVAEQPSLDPARARPSGPRTSNQRPRPRPPPLDLSRLSCQ